MTWHSLGGKARSTNATRGRGGQFLSEKPAATQQAEPSTAGRESMNTGLSTSASRRDGVSSSNPKTRTTTKTVSLKSLYIEGEWWEALAAQYPNVDLHKELLKAMDWHGADRVKSPKLYFRNWIERASLSAPSRVVELTPAQIRERLRVVS